MEGKINVHMARSQKTRAVKTYKARKRRKGGQTSLLISPEGTGVILSGKGTVSYADVNSQTALGRLIGRRDVKWDS